VRLDTDAEISGLRALLRELVALSTIPAVWIEREHARDGDAPPLATAAVASALADALAGLLQLDFAFVRLRDPSGGDAVDVTRGDAWQAFPNWLERRLVAGAPCKETVPDIGAGSKPCHGFVVPVGLDGEGGLLAAASERGDFPTSTDQLLLSLAANQAATAFQSARLIHERRRAEEELREARDELEVKVAERTIELERLADEQAALRRVATLVAQGVEPGELFSAVSAEVGRLFGTGLAAVTRLDRDAPAFVFVGVAKTIEPAVPVGTRWELEESLASTKVVRTGRSARAEAADISTVAEPIATTLRGLEVVSTVASPIVVESRLWGAMSVSSTDEPLPPDTEQRLEKFTELVATAIANAESRSELAASRLRIVAASDDARRRIERDLHDGTQQRLVTLLVQLRGMKEAPPTREAFLAEVSRLQSELASALEELRELSRGIHPAILSEGGLGPALRVLMRRSMVPVELEVATVGRLAEPIEVAAYFVASEALANATKHAQASRIHVSLATRDGSLVLSIRDDGIGGADPARGSGLLGLADRVETLGGSIHVRSAAGDGTALVAELPLELAPADGANA
jgi:signal transduction histidine kinase